jgi:hypothetical protein
MRRRRARRADPMASAPPNSWLHGFRIRPIGHTGNRPSIPGKASADCADWRRSGGGNSVGGICGHRCHLRMNGLRADSAEPWTIGRFASSRERHGLSTSSPLWSLYCCTLESHILARISFCPSDRSRSLFPTRYPLLDARYFGCGPAALGSLVAKDWCSVFSRRRRPQKITWIAKERRLKHVPRGRLKDKRRPQSPAGHPQITQMGADREPAIRWGPLRPSATSADEWASSGFRRAFDDWSLRGFA